MKLLPKSQVLSRINAQKKTEIDSGVTIAKKIDVLRETYAHEESNLRLFRENAVKDVTAEIKTLCAERDVLKEQIVSLNQTRTDLIKPLDAEWAIVKEAQAKLIEDQEILQGDKKNLKSEWAELDVQRAKVIQTYQSATQKEHEAEQNRADSIEHGNSARTKLHEAKVLHEDTVKEKERVYGEIEGLRRSYEVGIETNKLKAKELEEKEEDLIERENHITTQQLVLRKAKLELDKQNATRNTTK